jgi:hypothetical protein
VSQHAERAYTILSPSFTARSHGEIPKRSSQISIPSPPSEKMNYNVHNVRALSDDVQEPKHVESEKVADGLHRMRKILEEEKQQHKVPFYYVDPAQIAATPHSEGNIRVSKARYTHFVER